MRSLKRSLVSEVCAAFGVCRRGPCPSIHAMGTSSGNHYKAAGVSGEQEGSVDVLDNRTDLGRSPIKLQLRRRPPLVHERERDGCPARGAGESAANEDDGRGFGHGKCSSRGRRECRAASDEESAPAGVRHGC